MKTKLALASALLALGLATPSMAAPFNAHPQPQPAAFGNGHFGQQQPAAFGNRNHRPAQWELIGTSQVSFRKEKDTIYARGNDRHRQIMICVYNQPVRVTDLDVRFANGRAQDLNVRNVLNAGSCTRAIDLAGNKRDIRSVSIAYKALPNFKIGWKFAPTATVKVFAR